MRDLAMLALALSLAGCTGDRVKQGMNLRPLSATALLTLTASAESGCGCQQILDYGPLSLEE